MALTTCDVACGEIAELCVAEQNGQHVTLTHSVVVAASAAGQRRHLLLLLLLLLGR
jgi:hypothetical protein